MTIPTENEANQDRRAEARAFHSMGSGTGKGQSDAQRDSDDLYRRKVLGKLPRRKARISHAQAMEALQRARDSFGDRGA